MKRRFSAFLCMLVLLTAIAGCGQPTQSQSDNSADERDYTTISVVYPQNTPAMASQGITDIDLVEDEINKITTKKLGIRVDLVPLGTSYTDNLYTKILGNEKIDLMCVSDSEPFYSDGYLLELDALIAEYGSDISDYLEEEAYTLGQINGIQYGLGTNRDYVGGYGICMRKDLIDKYGIDLDSVKNIYGFEGVLDIICANEPEMFGIMPKNTSDTFVSCCKTVDKLGDSLGVLSDQGQFDTVTNYFESEEYESFVRLFHRWYEKGYIPEDILTISTVPQTLVRDGMLFSYMAKIKPGFSVQESTSTGREMVTLPLFEPFYVTSRSSATWCIFSGSQYPEESMQLLNLMYSDADIMNLLCWGIEGRHYVVCEDGTIDFPDGVTASTSGYNPNNNWVFPNQYIAHVWKGNPLDLSQQTIEYNKNAKKSIAYGFVFDPANVSKQYQTVGDVYSKYMRGIELGVLNPDETLPQMRQELNDAGIYDIIREKQAQLDRWIAEK